MKKLTVVLILVAAVAFAARPGAQAQQPPPAAQSEFVPVDDLPQQEQLPAAPLVIGAYAVAWVVLLVYLGSLWRRLQKVDRELADVARRVAERSRT